MKKFLLLAAVVAPLFASAEVKDYVRYEMPAGAFYYSTEGATTILLPPTTTLAWPNTSFYYDSSMMESYPLQSTFRWAVKNVNPFGPGYSMSYSSDSILTTGPDYTALTPFVATITLPTLTDTFDGEEFKGVKGATVYVGSTPNDIDFTTYNPAPDGMNLENKTIDQFTMGAEDLDGMWSSEIGDNSGFYVAGFAQKIDYPGAPYVLSGLTVNQNTTTTADGSITVSIYPFPGVGKPLAEKPIYSQTFSTDEGTVDLTSFTFTNAVAITQTVVVTFTEITTQKFAPTVVVATQKEHYPAPVNQGAYAVASYSNSDGTIDNALVEWTTPIEYSGNLQQIATLPIALDINFNVDYTFFQPIYVTSDDKPVTSAEDLVVNFDDIVSLASFRCVSSSPADYKGEDLVTFTQPDGSELPEWIEVYATDPTDEEVAALKKQYGIQGDADARFLNVTITPVRHIPANVQIKATVYGGANAIFTVHSTTSGIQTITSDADIVAREYYDLAGRRLTSAPTSGFFIEKAIRADGTTTSSRRLR